ncbi:hypothetical protein [Kribbella sp. NPDC023855]|uniref:hypothetical protein n=1 Tax=Kribbella sp. NPDC023855 TaxID=3154698 RepID=UPI0033F50F2E
MDSYEPGEAVPQSGETCSPEAELSRRLRRFAELRGWERASTPAALILNLVSEVGEVAQHFRWLSPTQAAVIMEDQCSARQIGEELGDGSTSSAWFWPARVFLS